MHLAPEHVCKAKMIKNQFKTCSRAGRASNTFRGLPIKLWPWNMYETNSSQFLLDVREYPCSGAKSTWEVFLNSCGLSLVHRTFLMWSMSMMAYLSICLKLQSIINLFWISQYNTEFLQFYFAHKKLIFFLLSIFIKNFYSSSFQNKNCLLSSKTWECRTLYEK